MKQNIRTPRAPRQIRTSQARRKEDASVSAWQCTQARDCFVQQAVAGLAIGLILIDPRGKVVWLNRAAEKLLDLPAERCLGQPFLKVLLDPQLAAFWHEVMCHDGNCMADVSIRWPRQIELKLNATQCLGKDGHEIGRALLFCDVTSDRNLRIELTKEMADRLLSMSPAPGAPPAQLATLTAQELKSLRLLGRGLANEDIALKLNVASSTIRSHLKSVYHKLGFRSRAAAISFAIQQHLS